MPGDDETSRGDPPPGDAAPARGLSRRQVLRAGAGIGAAGALVGLGALGARHCERPGLGAPDQLGPSRFSLLAVGDTGRPSYGMGRWASGRRVAGALSAVHRRQPSDGLVLLGDNFYPNGLVEAELDELVRDRLVEPYRAFLELSRGGAEQLGVERECAACNPVPVYAVLGNHDYRSPGSARLQVREVPDLIPNWTMPRGLAELYELDEGVSLILFESIPWDEGRVAPALAACLARSRGPFRILATHYPMADPGNNYNKSYVRGLHALLADAGVPVQLFLSGHEHNLQMLRMEPPAPPLHVIAGSGSYTRKISDTRARRLFAAPELGFARVARRSIGGREVLDVTLYEVELWPWPEPSPRPVARAWVDVDGAVQARIAA